MYIYKRKDNRYEGRYDDPFSKSKNGKSSVYGKTYRETKKKLLEAQANVTRRCSQSSKNDDVNGFLSQWLNNDVLISVKASTFDTYLYYFHKHVQPYFTGMRLNELDRNKIQDFCNYLYREGRLDKQGGLGAGTVKDIYGFLNRAFLQAMKDGLLVKNPCEDVKLPLNYIHLEIFTVSEQQRLIRYLNSSDEAYKTGIYLALYAGLRIGEICGLKWGDLDLDEGLIFVKRSIRRINNRFPSEMTKTEMKTEVPKSLHSSRSFYLPEDLLLHLRGLEKKLPESETADHRFVLTGRNGKYLDPRTLYAHYKKVLVKSQLPDLPFHALRHTFATRAQERGVDLSTLSQILGHNDPAFTVRRYGHTTKENQKAQIKKLNDGFIHTGGKSIA